MNGQNVPIMAGSGMAGRKRNRQSKSYFNILNIH